MFRTTAASKHPAGPLNVANSQGYFPGNPLNPPAFTNAIPRLQFRDPDQTTKSNVEATEVLDLADNIVWSFRFGYSLTFAIPPAAGSEGERFPTAERSYRINHTSYHTGNVA